MRASGRWTVVLPVKGGRGAKSRLAPGGAPGPALGAALATPLALDALDAAAAAGRVGRVLVVTADTEVAGAAAAAGARVVPESAPGAGLDAAVRDGADAAGGGPVAVLLADRPSLRPRDLDDALAAAEAALASGATSVVVPDATGTGTAVLAAATAGDLRPAFGAGSAAAHEALGARRLDLDLPRLRLDVDVLADLEAAAALGLGPRTAAALARALAQQRS